jgi:hypothetical protein
VTSFALTGQPGYQPGEEITVTVVSDSGSPSIELVDRTGEPIPRGQQKPIEANYGWLKVPHIEEWGTIFTLLKAPSDLSVPLPIAQRGGSTLWFADSPIPTSGPQLTEWVEADHWYVVASHVSTDHVWWDVAEWGGGFGSTLSVETPTESPDTPLLFIAAGQPLTIATLQFFNRTFGHDETMSFADGRVIPGDAASVWNLDPENSQLVERDGTTQPMVISVNAQLAHSWNSTGPRARKRAVEICPSNQVASKRFTFTAETVGTYTVRLSKRNYAFAEVATPTQRTSSPMVSLIDTPMPAEDLG